MEDNCYFICRRGTLKSCDFHSSQPRSSWAHDYQYLVDMVKGINMYDGMSIYLCTDMIPFFYYEILPRLKHNFYIVSGDSDATVPDGHIDIWHGNPKPLERDLCLHLLNDSRLIKWFAENCIMEHEKLVQLPTGLDYHTIATDPSKFWRAPHEGYSPKHQEMILKNILNESRPFYERENKIFAHVSLAGKEARKKDLDLIPPNLVEINLDLLPRTEIWKEIIKYTFAFSPWGYSPDPHRTWEILCLGSIPIIQSVGSNHMFDDLPVLIVDKWSDITQELLANTIEKFKNKKFNYNKLFLKYWVDQFSCPPKDFIS